MLDKLRLMRWYDFGWCRDLQIWTTLAMTGCPGMGKHVFRGSLALAQGSCNYNWAQVFACLQQHGVHVPIVNGNPIKVGSLELQRAVAHQQQAHMQSLSLGPRTTPFAGARFCTYYCWFLWPEGKSISGLLGCPH